MYLTHYIRFGLFVYRSIILRLSSPNQYQKLSDLRVRLHDLEQRDEGDYDTGLISVVIPTYNEEVNIESCLHSVLNCTRDVGVEIVVSDGGSADKTLALVRTFADGRRGLTVKIVEGGRSRSQSLNLGSAAASGDLLLFLHADTQLPSGWTRMVRGAFAKRRGGGGLPPILTCFRFSTNYSSCAMRLIERCTNWRACISCHPYGDQALCLKKQVFEALGRFPDLPLMEDFELVDIVRNLYPESVQVLEGGALTSGRRWQTQGALQNTLRNQAVIFGRTLGLPYDTLAMWYYGKKGKKDY